MRRALIILFLLGTGISIVHGQEQKNQTAGASKTERQIIALDREWADAIARGDVATIDRLFADDLIVTSGSGEVRSKAQEMDDLKPNPDITTYFFKTEDVRARVYKDAAVVTGLARWRIRYQGRDIDHQRRYTSVFIKQQGRWRIVAQQFSRPPEQKK